MIDELAEVGIAGGQRGMVARGERHTAGVEVIHQRVAEAGQPAGEGAGNDALPLRRQAGEKEGKPAGPWCLGARGFSFISSSFTSRISFTASCEILQAVFLGFALAIRAGHFETGLPKSAFLRLTGVKVRRRMPDDSSGRSMRASGSGGWLSWPRRSLAVHPLDM